MGDCFLYVYAKTRGMGSRKNLGRQVTRQEPRATRKCKYLCSPTPPAATLVPLVHVNPHGWIWICGGGELQDTAIDTTTANGFYRAAAAIGPR